MNLKLKLGKAEHAQEEMEALGFKFGKDRVKKTAFTMDLIKNYLCPESPKRLKSFLHLCQYYSQFAEKFAEIAAPLWSGANLKKKFPADFWSGNKGRRQVEAFEQLKADLCKEVELTLPDFSKHFRLKTDWSKTALSAILMQKGANDCWRPVFFASRKCTPLEVLADTTEGELIALVFGIWNFEKYLAGGEFDDFTDNLSLSWLKDKHVTTVHTRQWQKAFAYLAQFRFLLHHKPGKEMEDVDALSRIDPEQAVSTEPSPATDAATEATEEHVAACAVFSANAHMRTGTCLVELEYTAKTPVRSLGSKNAFAKRYSTSERSPSMVLSDSCCSLIVFFSLLLFLNFELTCRD